MPSRCRAGSSAFIPAWSFSEHGIELASVLGHEIAHVTQRHIARMIGNQGRTGMVMLASMIVAIWLRAAALMRPRRRLPPARPRPCSHSLPIPAILNARLTATAS